MSGSLNFPHHQLISLKFQLVIVVLTLFSVSKLVECQVNDLANLVFNQPELYAWTNVIDEYNPYGLLNSRQKQFSEYVIVTRSNPLIHVYLVFFDPSIEKQSEQNERKEYYWKFFNSTGALPGFTVLNTTFQRTINFITKPNDFIAYHAVFQFSYITDLQQPNYDLIFEVPPGSANVQRRKTFVDITSFGLNRWRFSDDEMAYFHHIANDSIALYASYPYDAETSYSWTYYEITGQAIKYLENPCSRDLFVAYMIVLSRKEYAVTMRAGPQRQVYITIPLAMHDRGKQPWMKITKSFCIHFPNQCAQAEQLVMTNNHIIGLTDMGIFISDPLSSAPLERLNYKDRPLLAFHLSDPCENLEDFLICFDEYGINPLIHSIKLYYTPICYLEQHPNYRDIVIVVISHDVPGAFFLRDDVAWTVIFAEQPYTYWKVLVKGAIQFDEKVIHSIDSVYYNHQLNHFDFVSFVGEEVIPWKAWIPGERVYQRFVLSYPEESKYYAHSLVTEQGGGYLPKVFPNDFYFRKIEISVGSLDVLYLGNQLWTCESGGFFVRLSLSDIRNYLEYCIFNHADRDYICINDLHTRLYVGQVSADYRPYDMRVIEIKEVRELASKENWHSLATGKAQTDIKSAFGLLSIPLLIKKLKGVHFRSSFQGTLQLWYLEGSQMSDKSVIPTIDHIHNHTSDPKADLERIYGYLISTYDSNSAGAVPDLNSNTQIIDSIVILNTDAFIGQLDTSLERNVLPYTEFGMMSVPISDNLPHIYDQFRSALVPFLIDSITVALYEATIYSGVDYPKFVETVLGNTIECITTREENVKYDKSCELYISYLKILSEEWLPGFSSVAYAYVLKSIPMHAFYCSSRIHINPNSNDAFIYVNKSSESTLGPEPCADWQPSNFHFIGWTFYLPGHFSILITMPREFTLPDLHPPPWFDKESRPLYGKVTRTFASRTEIDVLSYEGFLINMSTKLFQEETLPTSAHKKTKSEVDFTEEDILGDIIGRTDSYRFPSLPSWSLHIGRCLFDLKLLPNPIIKSSGGIIPLDLHDTLSFSVLLLPRTPQGEIIMQQVLLKVTNSNVNLLRLQRQFTNLRTSQRYDITVRPTGLAMGLATVTIRMIICSPPCTGCAFTYVFQITRAMGRKLRVHYPVTVPAREILTAEHGHIMRNGTIIYMELPVNYRPPSVLGMDIPTGGNIYNADPSKPKDRSMYKISQESGEFKFCRNKVSREECECTPYTQIQDHPDYTDCKRIVYRVKRAKEFMIRVTYPPLMDPSYQHQQFFTDKPHIMVWVEEINGRTDYSLYSDEDSYMRTINSESVLNRGHKFYDGSGLYFTCHGTGLYHFKTTLGDFDSFLEVSGYFTVYSDDVGLDDLTFLLILVSSLIMCFLILLFGFIRVKRRLMSHLPRRDIVTKKVTKIE